jgi:hypothetical protein
MSIITPVIIAAAVVFILLPNRITSTGRRLIIDNHCGLLDNKLTSYG